MILDRLRTYLFPPKSDMSGFITFDMKPDKDAIAYPTLEMHWKVNHVVRNYLIAKDKAYQLKEDLKKFCWHVVDVDELPENRVRILFEAFREQNGEKCTLEPLRVYDAIVENRINRMGQDEKNDG